MKKQIQLLLGLLSLVVVAVYYWVNLPPINVLSGDFWVFAIFLLFILAINLFVGSVSTGLTNLLAKKQKQVV